MKIFFPARMRSEVSSTFERIVRKTSFQSSLVINDTVDHWITPNEEYPDIKIPILSAEIDIPEVEGWRVIAKLDSMGDEGMNLIRNFSGKEIPEQYRQGSTCDHCLINRYRKQTWLLQKGDDFKQVGSSCLDEFVGRAFDHVFYREIEAMIRSCEDGMSLGMGGGGEESYSLNHLLHVVHATSQVYGFVSKKTAEEKGWSSTSERVWTYLNPSKNRPRDPKIDPKENLEHIANCVAWVRSLPANKRENDYMHNLYVSSSVDYVLGKSFGLICSLLSAYEREIAYQAKISNSEPKAVSQYVGKVGVRQDYNLTLKFKTSYENDFGTGFIMSFVDESGNQLVWFTTSPIKMDIGDSMKIKGTVKAHNERNGVKQTILSRCTKAKLNVTIKEQSPSLL